MSSIIRVSSIILIFIMTSCLSIPKSDDNQIKNMSVKKIDVWNAYKIDKINRIIDGDTFNCDIDLGMNIILRNQTIRLYGGDAFEKDTLLGIKATQATRDYLSTGTLTIETNGKKDDFGRVLGKIYNGSSLSLIDFLQSQGLTTGRFTDK